MDHAVSLVQTYLHLNGYFTTTEYPIVESSSPGKWRSVTDIDVLAFRFPKASHHLNARFDETPLPGAEVDPLLAIPNDRIDVVIGEVKEGRASMNVPATDPAVLRAVLTRFGCFDATDELIEQLRAGGSATTSSGYQVRILVFGGQPRDTPDLPCHLISLGQVLKYLQDYVRSNWKMLRHIQFKDPAFGFLMTLEKAKRGERRTRRDTPADYQGNGNRRRSGQADEDADEEDELEVLQG